MKTLIALALDLEEKEKLHKMVKDTKDLVDFFKIGPVALLSVGLEILEYVTDNEKDIFIDMKFFDIPSVIAKAISSLGKFRVKIVTVHASGGRELMENSVKAANKMGIDVAAVTILTSHKAKLDDVLELSKMAKECGAKWVVCQPRLAKEVKDRVGIKVISPGIRLSENRDDHRDIFSPSEAKEAGIDMIVVGRPVIFSDNPPEVLRKIRQALCRDTIDLTKYCKTEEDKDALL